MIEKSALTYANRVRIIGTSKRRGSTMIDYEFVEIPAFTGRVGDKRTVIETFLPTTGETIGLHSRKGWEPKADWIARAIREATDTHTTSGN